MGWDYFWCSRGHVYRVKKSHKGSPHVTCPFCGSTWKFKSTKKRWSYWRENYFGKGYKE